MQRLIAIRIIKAYRTISYESFVLLGGITPIDIKIQRFIIELVSNIPN